MRRSAPARLHSLQNAALWGSFTATSLAAIRASTSSRRSSFVRSSIRARTRLCIPPTLAVEHELKEVEKRGVTLADGNRHRVSYVGPLQISFGRRHSFGGAFALADEVLVGGIALQDMDLVIAPALESVTVASPEAKRRL
jgi:hypothetical protein